MNTLENEIRKAAEETAEAVLQQDICCDGQGQEEDGPAEEQEIQTVKKQLWEEKVRLEETRTVLEQEKEKLHEEQERFRQEVQEMQKEMARQNQRLLEAQKSLKKDELFFQQKMEILKGGFAQLAEDKKAMEQERIRLEARREERNSDSGSAAIRLFFSGVSNPLTLKKRYRDLIKIFHPDNLCGDTKLLQQINKTYEVLLEETGWQKKA